MSKLVIFVSATIVLIFLGPNGFAAPDREAPPSEPPASTWPADTSIDENMTVSPPPDHVGNPPPPDSRYYSYRQALTFRAGIASDVPDTDFNDTVLGFQYLFPKFLSPKLEAGADLHEEGTGHIHVGVRWYWWERDYFRPSVKLGLDHLVESDEGFATIAQINNYFARASGALEYVVWNPYSLRLEAELIAGLEKQRLIVTLGISRGW